MKFRLAVLSGVSGGNLWRVESQKQPPNLILQELSTMLRVARLETEKYNTPVLPLIPGSISLKCQRVRRLFCWWYKYKITPLYTLYTLYIILYTTPISGPCQYSFCHWASLHSQYQIHGMELPRKIKTEWRFLNSSVSAIKFKFLPYITLSFVNLALAALVVLPCRILFLLFLFGKYFLI